METVVVLVAIHLAVFAVMVVTARRPIARTLPPETLLRFGALHPPAIRDGQWTRVFSAMFLHLGPEHLFTNMIALASMGALILPDYGRARFVAIYVVGGVAGSLASLAWRWNVNPVAIPTPDRHDGLVGALRGLISFGASRSSITAGASSGICGLVAAGAVRGLAADSTFGSALGHALLQWAVFALVCGMVTEADNVGHLGGLAGGAIAGWLLVVGRNDGVAQTGLGFESVALVMAVVATIVVAMRVRDPAISYRAQVDRGDALRAGGFYEGAVERYRHALWLEPRGAEAHRGLAQSLTASGDFVAALESAECAAECDPESDDAHAMVERLMVRLGRK
jgi:membrane associated rhomboid family serine protease